MNDLKELYQRLQFEDILTYIQSGNVIFNAETKLSDKQLADTIEKEIYARYNFQVPVIIGSVKRDIDADQKKSFPSKRECRY